MIRVRQVEVDINKTNKEELIQNTAQKLKINPNDIKQIKISKKSLDARKKPYLKFIYEVDIKVTNEEKILKIKNNDILKTPDETFQFKITGTHKMKHRPIIVGAGPAGLFCAYLLA